MIILGGVKVGETEYRCECGRSLGYGGEEGRMVSCECGKTMVIQEVELAVREVRESFVLSGGGS